MIEILTVLASMYWEDSHVATGAKYDKYGITAASRTLPLGTCINVEYKGRTTKVLINDRGPCFSKYCQSTRPDLLKRKLDLSLGTAQKLQFTGLDHVTYYKTEC